MEYSKDIVLGVKFFNGEDKHENLKVKGIRENKYDKAKKIVKKITKTALHTSCTVVSSYTSNPVKCIC